MDKRTSVTPQEVLEAIPGSKGLIVNIERVLCCTRDAVKNCLAANPKLQKEMEDEEDKQKGLI